MPQVSIVIINYNSGPFLAGCVAALGKQSFDDFEVLIVDNASSDDSISRLPPLPARFQILHPGANLGFAAGNNLAIAKSNAPWIATLNPDTYPDPDWLAELMAATRRHPHVAMFGCQQIEPGDEQILDGYGDNYHAIGAVWRGLKGRRPAGPLIEGETFAPCAAAALYRRDAFVAAGGFDESFFCYCEDIDLAFRLRLYGQLCVQVPAAKVVHVGSAITGRYSDFSVYHGMRNRLWMFVKNMPGYLFWALLPAHVLMQGGALLRSAFIGTFRPTFKGLVDGLWGLKAVVVARREIQNRRQVPESHIARALTWSPLLLLRRDAHIRPLPGP